MNINQAVQTENESPTVGSVKMTTLAHILAGKENLSGKVYVNCKYHPAELRLENTLVIYNGYAFGDDKFTVKSAELVGCEILLHLESPLRFQCPVTCKEIVENRCYFKPGLSNPPPLL